MGRGSSKDQSHVQGWHFLYTSDALSLPFIPGTEVCGHRVARPAPPSPLMNEGEPTLEPGREASRNGRGLLGPSLEVGSSGLLVSQRPSGTGLSTRPFPTMEGVTACLLQLEPAQGTGHHWLPRTVGELGWGWGDPTGRSLDGPEFTAPCEPLTVRIRVTNSLSGLL